MMVWNYKPKRLAYEDIRRIADEFLEKYNPGNSIPVPIEEIVEFEFGLNIMPVRDLEKTWDVVGFTSSDLTSITIDQYVLEKQEGRYRFTLAHEIGHIIIHGDLYSNSEFNNTMEWKEFITSFPAEDYRWFEYQAYAFAGLVLVPKDALENEANKWLREVQAFGAFEDEMLDPIWDRIVEKLADTFCVSKDVINKRLQKDELRNF
jgi:Zn-dependent peptidase ImmA (M78 family)